MVHPPQPGVEHRCPPPVKRWEEQRWLIDNIIRANGIDWDQPRSQYLAAPCGGAANADFAAIRQRIQKTADIGPAFAATARRREDKARAAEAEGHSVDARDNYFMAAIHWGAAQWPYDENDEANIALNKKKRKCYQQYARLADHPVEAAWIPFKQTALPAWFHLPPGYNGGRLACVIAIKPVVDWLAARPEIDPGRIGVTGTGFGSFFGTIMAAHEPRLAACAVVATCLEPGCHTIFEEASPTFKKRFMYMSGYTDEEAFDELCKTLTWEGHAERIRCPYLCVAGEAEELSPRSIMPSA